MKRVLYPGSLDSFTIGHFDLVTKFDETQINRFLNDERYWDMAENFVKQIFTQPIVAPALNNRKVVFACLQNGTFIEFILS